MVVVVVVIMMMIVAMVVMIVMVMRMAAAVAIPGIMVVRVVGHRHRITLRQPRSTRCAQPLGAGRLPGHDCANQNGDHSPCMHHDCST